MSYTFIMNIEKSGDICILFPEISQVDVTNSVEFGRQLSEALGGAKRFILDLDNVSFMDSSGLGCIISTLRTVNEEKKNLVICNINDAVRVLFEMVRLSQIAVLVKTREEALVKLSP